MTDAAPAAAATDSPAATPLPPVKAAAHDVGEPPQQERVLLHMPVDIRSVALMVIAVLAGAFALQWGRAVFIPLLVGIMFSYALTPIVDTLETWHLPRAAGAAAVLLALVGALGWGAWNLSDEASALVETLPDVAVKLRQAMQGQRQKPVATIEKVQQAATEIERVAESATTPASAVPGEFAASSASAGAAASGASATAAPVPARRASRQARAASHPSPGGPSQTREVTHVVVEKPGFDIKGLL